ncbi:oxygen-dependent coproporphyrinogen oxidase [Bacteriovoracaceae bacterium]|nr:oxygen-dependent coproporphyrinogen oxidase [Bacteriovoracaceae bacterium]
MLFRNEFTSMVQGVQDIFCEAIEKIDGGSFQEDKWDRNGGGGGRTRVLEDGNVFEKAGVNTSVVYGKLPPDLKGVTVANGGDDTGTHFWAAGISLVIHPKNPFIPTTHANFRYFEKGGETGEPKKWWFGGGSDLTPYYLFEEDAEHFHRTLKKDCDKHDPTFYPRFKKECDDYFYLPHRLEHRGVGGIFFDDLRDRERPELFQYVKDCAHSLKDAYIPIVEKRLDTPYEDSHREWQLVRRGRYVEFNLLYDRGTTFGLKTGGRVESILMSLPPKLSWKYNHIPDPNSPEGKLVEVVRTPREWI